jgi:hypothetical protein
MISDSLTNKSVDKEIKPNSFKDIHDFKLKEQKSLAASLL